MTFCAGALVAEPSEFCVGFCLDVALSFAGRVAFVVVFVWVLVPPAEGFPVDFRGPGAL